MHIQIHTDHNIAGHESLSTKLKNHINASLNEFSDQITRVEVHLSDEKSGKENATHSFRCVIEARIEGHQPLAATDHASDLELAVDGGIEKLTHLIKNTLGRIKEQKRHRTDPPLATQEPDLDQY